MNNNLIIKNARIITPLGTSALKGKEMNQLLDLTGGTVKVTDGVITYAGPSVLHVKNRKKATRFWMPKDECCFPDSSTHIPTWYSEAIAPKNLFGA